VTQGRGSEYGVAGWRVGGVRQDRAAKRMTAVRAHMSFSIMKCVDAALVSCTILSQNG
jgi:hypothetical protein